MKKNLFAFLSLLIGINSYAQVIVSEVTITAPPAPSGTVNPVNLTTGSLEYNAEYEITLTDNFEVQQNSSPGANYFLARILPPTSYAELKEKLDGGFCGTRGGVLYFKYIEKYTNGSLKYQVYDYQRNALITNQTGSFALTKILGTNYFTLPVRELPAFVGTNDINSYYILEVESDKGDKYLLRFKFITEQNEN